MNLAINLISNGGKLSIQFPELGRKYSKKIKVIAQIQYHVIINCLKIAVLQGLKKLTLKKIYSIIMSSTTSRTYFEKKIPLYNFQWKDIYTLPRKVTINAYLRSFQYKILNNILYLNKKLHTFGLSNTQLCSFCKMEEETISNLFYSIKGGQDKDQVVL